MRKLTLLCALATLGVAANAQLIYQDPGTGDNAWGVIDAFSFYDDFTVGSPGWEIDRIETYEYYGDADSFGDTYRVDIWTAPSDLGGSIVAGTYTHTDVSVGPIGGYGFETFAVGFQLDATPGCDGQGLVLKPGTYWLRFWAGDSGVGYFWYNANVGAPNGSSAYVDGFGYSESWAGQSFDMSFKMEGCVVPEPATLLAMGAGLAALAARLRRK
ncbi:MAG TPA: PEP-CTERM sorting domain-containing protein [Fimbriimonadales bacterium]|nr:PEP-CTERM sorting domain-containing protein [Fimbriimonadales bacterium]